MDRENRKKKKVNKRRWKWTIKVEKLKRCSKSVKIQEMESKRVNMREKLQQGKNRETMKNWVKTWKKYKKIQKAGLGGRFFFGSHHAAHLLHPLTKKKKNEKAIFFSLLVRNEPKIRPEAASFNTERTQNQPGNIQ